MLPFHPAPRSKSNKVTTASKTFAVGNYRKKRKLNTKMSPILSPDSSNNETENKTSSLNIKTDKKLKLEKLQSLIVVKTIELTQLEELVVGKRKEYLFLQQKCNAKYFIANTMSSNYTKDSSTDRVPPVGLIRKTVMSHSVKEDYIIE